MNRFFSSVAPSVTRFTVRRSSRCVIGVTCLLALGSSNLSAQGTGSGQYMVDPQTGDAYARVVTEVTRPVTETRVERRNQTVYTPKVVTTTTPSTRTVYTPVLEHKWEARMHGRWNPFVQPTIAYHQVPRTRWEARSEVVQRQQTRTEWVAENRTIEVPTQRTAWKTERQEGLRFVGKVAPRNAPMTAGSNTAIASRLRPLSSNEQIQTMPSSSPMASIATRLPSQGSIGTMTSDPPRRSPSQQGMRVQELSPVTSSHGRPLPSNSTLFR